MIKKKSSRSAFWAGAIFLTILFSSPISNSWNHTFSFRNITSAKDKLKPGEKPTIYLIVGIIWEGESLKLHNIEAIRKFRQYYKSIPMIHFINPSYFTKPGTDIAEINDAFNSVILKDDKIGIHLSGWKSFIEKSNVIFRNAPTFWGDVLNEQNCSFDCGKTVPISIYRKEELASLIQNSINILTQELHTGKSSLAGSSFECFMAEGWMVSEDLWQILAGKGIKYDFSGVNLDMVKDRINLYPLYNWLKIIWEDVSNRQPYIITTNDNLELTELGQIFNIVDFIDLEKFNNLFSQYIDKLTKNPNEPLVIGLGLQQETAYKYLNRIMQELQQVFSLSQKHNIKLIPINLSDTNN